MPPDLLLVTGPPFGEALVRPLLARLGGGAVALDLLGGTACEQPEDLEGRLVEAVHRIRPRFVVAHGTALPLALRVVALPVVAINGPVTRMSPGTEAWRRALLALLGTPAGARALPRALASSAGLRRAVVNPYVMRIERVLQLTSWRADVGACRTAATWLSALPRWLGAPAVAHAAVWGDADFLHPLDQALAAVGGHGAAVRVVRGGKFLALDEHSDGVAKLLHDLCRQ